MVAAPEWRRHPPGPRVREPDPRTPETISPPATDPTAVSVRTAGTSAVWFLVASSCSFRSHPESETTENRGELTWPRLTTSNLCGSRS
jgi:hypothetical protein